MSETNPTPSKPTAEALRAVLNEGRNGINTATTYSPFFPRLKVSDGALEAAKAAQCFWLLDIIATELEPHIRPLIIAGEMEVCTLRVKSTGRSALISAERSGDVPLWTKEMPSTDFPAGEWELFCVGCFEWDTQACVLQTCITMLPSEY